MTVVAVRRRVGITDVAAKAGVSVTTVSHVLSSRRPVSQATRNRVLKVIEELDYRPNELARSMRAQRTFTIALIVPDITDPFGASVARGLQDAVRPASYHCLVASTDAERDVERDILHRLLTRVDGVVLSGSGNTPEELEPVIDARLPLVLLGADTPGPGFDVVTGADHDSGALATKHLLERGHRRIAVITAPTDFGAPARRVEGYRDALTEAGLPADPALVVSAPVTRDGGAYAMAALMDLPDRPEAVICGDDVVAIGAVGAAAGRGLSVPADVAVMGFGDHEAAALVTPKLTTMALPSREHGRAAGELILERIRETEPGEPRRIVIPAVLVQRDSA
ncbi:ribose operon repressor [Phytomonospora endophytica]|nr:ribose operon repressor [Phytomonospora endophytica]